ncbi:MAG: ABC transporter permease [Methylococcus sp.]|jgi:phospholipid/cholesterol/gamma-HCH transport system permease protein|nr:MAG: ABC transporter permease [Methylococcus sp.]
MQQPQVDILFEPSQSARVLIGGAWHIGQNCPRADATINQLKSLQGLEIVRLESQDLTHWDSLLLTYIRALSQFCGAHEITLDTSGLPEGVQGLLMLAAAVPERQDAGRREDLNDGLSILGRHTLWLIKDIALLADFIGEAILGFLRLLSGRSQMRWGDFWRLVEACGPHALPIITLISTLVGMILAFVGAVQLKLFGAQIFIADLVGLGMAREMGAMMTAILMAGRTGSAFAAEIGSMTVNDEIDALKTSGFSPMDFLVMPRILAMFVTIPLLCLYADIWGMIGGALVAAGLFDISASEYLIQIQSRLRLIDFEVGIGKSAVFGILVATAGCLRGLRCQRNASSVGLATTSAVVTGIVYIVISDAVMTLLVTALNLYKR